MLTMVMARERLTALICVREIGIALAAVFAYFGVRGFTEGSKALAIENAHRLVDLEKALGIFWEPDMQEAIVKNDGVVTLMNWVYMFGHWPVIAVVAVWLVWRRPDVYYLTRNAFLISGLIGLVVFATFPVAPPRLAELDFVDTITERSESYRVLQPPAFVNQYAAMPSLHFGWNVLIAVAMVRTMHWVPVRVFAVALPVAMAFAVVLTANHFIIDAIAGVAVALFGLWVAWHWRWLGPRWLWGERPQGADP